MAEHTSKSNSSLTRLWTWVKNQWVQEVPQASALCEFDCRKSQCLEGEWVSCERRLSHAEGELMPERKPDQQ